MYLVHQSTREEHTRDILLPLATAESHGAARHVTPLLFRDGLSRLQ